MDELPAGPGPETKRSNTGLLVWVVVLIGALLILALLYQSWWG
jgi:hypothetical protein